MMSISYIQRRSSGAERGGGMEAIQFQKIHPDSLSAKAYQLIRESILRGSLHPGARIYEAQIADQMGISRSPIREAMRMLQADGLVEVRTNQGIYVKSLSPDEVWEIYTARILIEGFIAEMVAQRATPEDVAKFFEACDMAERAARRKDFETTVEADFRLHRLIWNVSGHQLLTEILSRLEVQIRMFLKVQVVLFDHLFDSVKEHYPLVQAIAEHDPEKAKYHMQHHIEEAGTLTVERLRQGKRRELPGPSE